MKKNPILPIIFSIFLLGVFFNLPAETDLPIVKFLNKSFYYYETEKGESLAGIAKKFGWDLVTLENANKEVMLPLSKGTLLYYPVVKASKDSETANPTENFNIVEKVAEDKIIEKQTQQPTTKNQKANRYLDEIPEIPDVDEPAVSSTLSPDSISTDTSEKEDENIIITPEISIAIILSDSESNKDMEFSRGALVAAAGMKNRPYQTRLIIIDGNLPENEVLDSLESFSPSYLVTTTGKKIPEYLIKYISDKNTPLVNAFDTKDETYLTNKDIIQIQTPTNIFNDAAAQYIGDKFSQYQLIVAGAIEPGDTMGEKIITTLNSKNQTQTEEIDIATLTEQDLSPEFNYVVYATPSKKEDVKVLLEKISVLRDRNPLSDIRVIGRPNWITFADSQKQLFGMNYVYMPTRFYFDADSKDSKTFIEDYKELFGHTPLKSYPVYSATAYDILNYISDVIMNTEENDFVKTKSDAKTLQTSFNFIKDTPDGGYVNKDTFIVEYNPYDYPSVITLK